MFLPVSFQNFYFWSLDDLHNLFLDCGKLCFSLGKTTLIKEFCMSSITHLNPFHMHFQRFCVLIYVHVYLSCKMVFIMNHQGHSAYNNTCSYTITRRDHFSHIKENLNHRAAHVLYMEVIVDVDQV
jgi:hypothetical protein